MKKFLAKVVSNGVQSPASSIMGGCLGYDDIMTGIQTKNYALLIRGIIIVISGFWIKENKEENPSVSSK